MKEKPGQIEFGFNAMLRYGWRIGDKKYWTIGLGPGVSIADKVRPRMMLGTGFCFGNKQRIIIDGGATLGYYDVLSQVYNENTTYSAKPSQVTVSQMKMGGYLSVGYMFWK